MLQVEYRPLAALIPYACNARTHSDAQVAQIAASLTEFGWTNPVLVDGANGVIAGHGRLAAARQLGLIEVPVIELNHLTPIQKRAYVIADNRLAETAGWDNELLRLEMESLDEAGFDLTLTGFEEDDLAALWSEDTSPSTSIAPIVDDAIPAPPARAVSATGDIWQIGTHRLGCGDAGDPAVVNAVMAGQLAALCFTSPPYASQRHYTTGAVDWDRLMERVFSTLPLQDAGQVLVNLGLVHRDNEFLPYWQQWLDWMGRQGWRRFGWYVWDQGPGMPGDWNGRLAPAFEFVFHFNRQARRPNKTVPCTWAGQETHLRPDGSSVCMRKPNGEIGCWSHHGQPTQDYRIPDAVIRVTRQKGAIGEGIDHPAVFPLELPRQILEAYSAPGEVCFEPFCGSGTSLLAAERTGRVMYAVELAPEYVDVALERFRRAYPTTPITLAATGQPWADVAAERAEKTP